MHRGTLDSGHYTCAAKLEQKWIKLDDDKVTEMQPSTVESNKEAYLLFYEQKWNECINLSFKKILFSI